MKYKLILCFRPISFMFLKNWYSLYRWNNPTEYENQIFRMIDIGVITIGYKYTKEDILINPQE